MHISDNIDYFCENNTNSFNMLVQFSVGNYLSFKEVNTFSMVASALKDRKVNEEDALFSPFDDKKLRLLHSAVIYGANASGKSNFIKALDFFKWFVINSSKETQAEESINTMNFALSTTTQDKPSYFEIIFFWKEYQYRYGFEADHKKIASEWLYQKHIKPKAKEIELFFRQIDTPPSVHEKFVIGHDLVEKRMVRPNALLLSVAAQFNEPVATGIFQWLLNFNVISGLQDDKYFSYSLSLLENAEYRQRIIDLAKYADLGIDDIKVLSAEVTTVDPEQLSRNLSDVMKKQELSKKIVNTLISSHQKFDGDLKEAGAVQFNFIQSESLGTLKYFSLAGPILNTLDNGNLLIIDELDTKLHPLLTLKIIELFNSKTTNPKNAQLIFTTHDTNLLSANIFRRDQVWFTQKDRYGATDLYSLAEYKIRNDASFEKDYLQGKYGAVPVFRDFSKLFTSKTTALHGE